MSDENDKGGTTGLPEPPPHRYPTEEELAKDPMILLMRRRAELGRPLTDEERKEILGPPPETEGDDDE